MKTIHGLCLQCAEAIELIHKTMQDQVKVQAGHCVLDGQLFP